jgi:hypothetical protein
MRGAYDGPVRRSIILCLAIACLASAAPAQGAPSFRALYDEYLRSGLVSGCAHSEAELQAALTSIPADVEAYDPGFSDALNAALENRAAGCAAAAPAPPARKGQTAADGSPGPARVRAPLTPAPEPSGPSVLPVQLLFLGALAAAALFTAVLLSGAPRATGGGRRR